jgi:imidazolonepropionase-like amidohydrolase
MPGILDSHSHMGIDRGLNEGSRSVVPEVRIADVIKHDDPAFFTALAGGITTIHTMHGSANTIGGQNETLKLKWGRPWEDSSSRTPP